VIPTTVKSAIPTKIRIRYVANIVLTMDSLPLGEAARNEAACG
jgi:hypothetical protein